VPYAVEENLRGMNERMKERQSLGLFTIRYLDQSLPIYPPNISVINNQNPENFPVFWELNMKIPSIIDSTFGTLSCAMEFCPK